MKKILSHILLIMFMPGLGFSQLTHLGIQAGFASEVKEPGFGIQVIYRVNDDIKLTPNVSYFLPHKITTEYGTQTFEWWMVNLDGNYVIIKQGIFEGYGLMGLNFSNITGIRDEVELGTTFKDKRSMLKLGLNVGAGLRLNLGDRVAPFGELRYTLGSMADFTFNEVSNSQFGIYAGILIRISEDKERVSSEE
jgi:hypothetical protein